MASRYRVVGGNTPHLRVGCLDRVHIRLPDRVAAAAWYSTHLGFEPVEEYRFWVDGVEGGPLQMSADGAATSIALLQASDAQPIVPQSVAFRVDAASFAAFAGSLRGPLCGRDGAALQPGDARDFDLCWAFDIADPWGHHDEPNCFDYETVRAELIEGDGVVPERTGSSDDGEPA